MSQPADCSILTLSAHGYACSLMPGLGGAILSLLHEGIPLLRVGDAGEVRRTACFPLVPFANRIDHGRFAIAGRTIRIAADPSTLPHALHGHGWQRPWQVEHACEDRARLRFDHDGGDWPWPYSAWQDILLAETGLTVVLTIENRHPTMAMPAGLGLHPYFLRTATTRVSATAQTIWHNDASGLAVSRSAVALFAKGPVPVADLAGLDNYFEAARPEITIADDRGAITLGGDGLGFHLYCPANEDYFCVEPTSHCPNSFGRGDFATEDIVAPRARKSQSYRIGHTTPAPAGA